MGEGDTLKGYQKRFGNIAILYVPGEKSYVFYGIDHNENGKLIYKEHYEEENPIVAFNRFTNGIDSILRKEFQKVLAANNINIYTGEVNNE